MNKKIYLGSFLLVMLGGSLGFADPLQAVIQPRQQIKVMENGREVAIYHSGEALDKSYIHPLWTPDHHCVTYDAPADHLHHRALCIGWPDISGTDFWAEINSPAGRRGKVLPIQVSAETLADGSQQIVEMNRWLPEDGRELVRGKYVWTFPPAEGNLQKVDVWISLEAVAEQVIFGSGPETPREYHGLTLRIGPLENIRYFNSEGTEGGQKCKGQPAKWCAASGLQQGGAVTVAIFDHPSNSSFPTRFYIQDQGMQFISSSPNFAKPKILKKGETWNLYYEVIAAGKPPQNGSWNLDELWSRFANKRNPW